VRGKQVESPASAGLSVLACSSPAANRLDRQPHEVCAGTAVRRNVQRSTTAAAMALSEIHLKLDGIKGESTSVRHKDEIVVESWSWSVASPPSKAPAAGAAAGGATFSDLAFTHCVDRASPELWKACATGRRIRDATLSLTRTGAGAQDYLVIKLSDVIVTSAALADTAADAQPPMESVGLHFAKVEYGYRPQKADGSLSGAVEFNFDLEKNKTF
jgi:type VI secretion system secreted protein Hcp